MTFQPSELVIAGWTGRDEAALKKHIRELEEIGVRPPKTTPIFYRVAASLFTRASEIQVSGPDTSGEVEFVLMQGNELRVAFTELLRRLPDMEYAAGGPVIKPSALVRSCVELKVRFTPET